MLLTRRALARVRRDGPLSELLACVAQRELDPYSAAEELLARLRLQ